MGKLRVSAYCRVSTNHEEQESSLETQISYYGKLIAEHKDWQLVKIYAERASGTQINKCPEFIKMIKACKQGKIDLEATPHNYCRSGSRQICSSDCTDFLQESYQISKKYVQYGNKDGG